MKSLTRIVLPMFLILTVLNCSQESKNQNTPSSIDQKDEFTYVLETNQEIIWKARHNEDTSDAYISSVNLINGSINIKDDKIKSGEIKIDINTLDNNANLPKNLIKHLKSPGYFNVLNFPDIKYTINNSSKDSLFGDLEIIGFKKGINFPCQIETSGDFIYANAEFIIDMLDFELPDLVKTHLLPDNEKAHGPSNLVTISFNLKAIKKY